MPTVRSPDPERVPSVAPSAIAVGVGPDQCADLPAIRAAVCDAAGAASPLLVEHLAHLRQTVVTFVQRRRREGVPVTRVLSEVQSLVWQVALGENVRELAQPIIAHAVRWSVDAYDAPPGASSSTSPNGTLGEGHVSLRS